MLNNELSPGELTSFLMYTLTVAFSFGGISALYADFMKAVGASERVFQLMDREPKVRFHGGVKLDRVTGQVEFRDVHFSYPSRPDVPVLNGTCFICSCVQCIELCAFSPFDCVPKVCGCRCRLEKLWLLSVILVAVKRYAFSSCTAE